MAEARSAARWEALSPGNRRRWRAAFGGEQQARTAYIAGASLTKSQRGHRYTPSSPAAALRAPWLYPRYVGRHTDELNELARREDQPQHGLGPRGGAVTGREPGARPRDEPYTWVIPDGRLDLGDWRFSRVFRTLPEAQLEARQSWAPAGVVMIVDRGPEYVWRYEVWYGYPESRGMPTRRLRGGRMGPPATVERENIEALRATRNALR